MQVVMLLDNHYAPDRRVEYERQILTAAGLSVRIVAWDRRPAGREVGSTPTRGDDPDVVRIPVSAPPGGGVSTLRAMLSFAWAVWRHRRTLLSNADVLVVHDIYLLPVAAALSLVQRTPLIYDAHEEYSAMEAARLPRWWCRTMTIVESLLARRASCVVVPGQSRRPRWSNVGIEPLVLRNVGGRSSIEEHREPDWDLIYISGSLSSDRRPDILLDAARLRPDLRFALAGHGRDADRLQNVVREIPNLDFLGWVANPVELMSRSVAVFYGLDPDHAYSEKACPNTVYQAIHAKRPLLFLCGGEPDALASQFKVGIRCEPTAESVVEALDAVAHSDWEFDHATAMLALETRDEADAYVSAVQRVRGTQGRSPRRTSASAAP